MRRAVLLATSMVAAAVAVVPASASGQASAAPCSVAWHEPAAVAGAPLTTSLRVSCNGSYTRSLELATQVQAARGGQSQDCVDEVDAAFATQSCSAGPMRAHQAYLITYSFTAHGFDARTRLVCEDDGACDPLLPVKHPQCVESTPFYVAGSSADDRLVTCTYRTVLVVR